VPVVSNKKKITAKPNARTKKPHRRKKKSTKKLRARHTRVGPIRGSRAG
jgi:hypothetical protein